MKPSRALFALLAAAAAGPLLVACSGDDGGGGTGSGTTASAGGSGTGGSGTGGSASGGAGTGGSASGGSDTGGAGTGGSGTGGSASGGSGGGGAGGGSGEPKGLGAACNGDADCLDGECAAATDDHDVFFGGPAHGYCTKTCDADADCAASGGACLKLIDNQPGTCVLECEIGPDLKGNDDPLSKDKCLAREDVRCQDLGQGGVCLPTCGSDAQCDAGYVCDPGAAVCVKKADDGSPTGAKCDPQGGQGPKCAGFCVSFGGGVAACSSYCALGGKLDGTADCGGLAKGLCAYNPPGNGAGDMGFCAAACSKHGDCQNPAFWCFSEKGVTGDLVANGYCYGAISCDEPGGDCPTGKCTETAFGKFCLDPAFPQ